MSTIIADSAVVIVKIPSGELSLEDLISHIDHQLGTDFAYELAQADEESFSQGRIEMQNRYLNVTEPTASYQHDHDALDRIQTAEVTGYVQQPVLRA